MLFYYHPEFFGWRNDNDSYIMRDFKKYHNDHYDTDKVFLSKLITKMNFIKY